MGKKWNCCMLVLAAVFIIAILGLAACGPQSLHPPVEVTPGTPEIPPDLTPTRKPADTIEVEKEAKTWTTHDMHTLCQGVALSDLLTEEGYWDAVQISTFGPPVIYVFFQPLGEPGPSFDVWACKEAGWKLVQRHGGPDCNWPPPPDCVHRDEQAIWRDSIQGNEPWIPPIPGDFTGDYVVFNMEEPREIKAGLSCIAGQWVQTWSN